MFDPLKKRLASAKLTSCRDLIFWVLFTEAWASLSYHWLESLELRITGRPAFIADDESLRETLGLLFREQIWHLVRAEATG